ncbi:hypothetical protein CCHR01_12307 [Colletotrichum chrysophilum]|uniref:Ubiquitin-like domain-containing protein n=1 Tax=Colletotrichum chrysophilum TaxID=1836956 RepID=A0AAD9EDW8_9PEZI|nr:hypothetical protein CCHR01_12307 [Colletotrichum chrysophilum]
MSNLFVPPTVEDDAREDTPQQGPSAADESPGNPPNDPRIQRSAGKVKLESIKFKDAVGRKFIFPYTIVKSWAGMEECIKQAFLHVDIMGPHVQEGHYDLVGPDGNILLPQIWECLVEPGWTIEMRMWPMEKVPPPWSMGSTLPVPPGMRQGNPGFAPPPPPPGWNNGKPWYSGYTGPGVPGNGVPPPPPPPPPRIINVGPPPQKKRTKQGSMLSWMTGMSAKKKSSKSNEYDGSFTHNEPLPEESVRIPPASPSSTSAPNLGMMSRKGAPRPTLANEMIAKQPLSRNFAGQSLNLRPKKTHEKLEQPVSASTSYSSTVTSGSSSVSYKRSVSSIKAMDEEDTRRSILQRGLIVKCVTSSRPLGRAMTSLSTAKIVVAPSDVLELSAARIYRDGFEKMTIATLELVKQRAVRAPPSQEQCQAGSSTLTWKHFMRPVMNLQEFEDISRSEFRANDAIRSAVDHLFVSIRKMKLDEEWHIKPGTVLRCDTKPGEKVPASVTFMSVPYLYADSFKSPQRKYHADDTCLPRRLHEALSSLGSADEDKRQHFRRNEGQAKHQVLWIGQTWIIVGASSLLTYGTIPRENLEGDSIAIRDQRTNDEEEDCVIQIMDQDRRLFYLPADKCKSFYELETSAKDKMNGPEQDLNHCDLSFSLPNNEVLNPSKWSSLLNLGVIPTLKVSLNFYSDASTGSTRRLHSTSSSIKGDKDVDTKSLQHDTDDAVSKTSIEHEFRGAYSRKKFVDFAVVQEAASSLPDNIPQLNSKVPPFFDWKPKTRTVTTQTASDRFRERLDEVEGDLLELYRFKNQKTSITIQQVYKAFDGRNIYEDTKSGNLADFSHRRRSQMKDATVTSGAQTPSARLVTLAEDFFSVSIPTLEAFVVSDFKSSVTSKYFDALTKVISDPTAIALREDETEPHETIHSQDDSKQKWVVSREFIKQADLRAISSLRTDGAQCSDCERGTVYANPDKAVSHLRNMHLVKAKTNKMLRDYLLTLPAALAERLNDELCELFVVSRNMLASILRRLVAIQSGVIHDDEFRDPGRGIPFYLMDGFKLIVLFVCALPMVVLELRWFYRDSIFDHNAPNLTSEKVQAQRKAMDKLGEMTRDLIQKAERTLVLPTGSVKDNNAENYMTSVGLNYVSLQIIFNLLRMPVHNRKKVSELYASYAKNLGAEIQRKPGKRQIPQIGALSSELNLLKDVVEWQTDFIDNLHVLVLPDTFHPSPAKDLDTDKLFGIDSELVSEVAQAINKEDESLDGTLELCNNLKALVSEMTEIMADDQGQAVFVFTVVTVTFLPLSFVASYLSMSGGTDGLGMDWGDVQARFWMVAGPLTAAVAALCFFIAGRGTIGRLLSRPTQHAILEDNDEGPDDLRFNDLDSEDSQRTSGGRRERWPRWRFRGRRQRNHSLSDASSSSSDEIVDD